MDSLRIATGEVRLMVNDDPARVVAFNPEDVLFAERFYQVMGEFDTKQLEYQARYAQLDTEGASINGLPTNVGAKLALLRETCEYFRAQIDRVFGAGTSQAAFGDAMTLSMFEQFFDGITPYIQGPRAGKMAQYVKQPAAKPKRRKHT